MKYLISNEAGIDLEKNWIYTFEKSLEKQADRHINLIFEEIEYITDKPESGKDYSYIRKGYYRTKVKSHFIYYRFSNKSKIVEIIRILHQQMDVEDRLR